MVIEQKKLKKRTNKEKIAICEKYEDYLKIINLFGNKIMLQKQLEEFALELGLVNSHSTFIRQLQELADYDIIKAEPFYVSGRKTQLHIIILKKFALRYLKGETQAGGSQRVSPVPPLRSNDRILKAVFRSSYILQRILPYLKDKKGEVGFNDIVHFLEGNNSSLLYEKNSGLAYAEKFSANFGAFINEIMMESQIERLKGVHQKRQEGLYKGSKSSEGKGKANLDRSGVEEGKKGEISTELLKVVQEKELNPPVNQKTGEIVTFKSKKDQRMYDFSFEDMIRANLNIFSVRTMFEEEVPKAILVTASLFDYKNSQDIYMFATQIACLYNMINGLLDNDIAFQLKVGIVGFDEDAVANMKVKAEEKVQGVFSKEPGERLKTTLKNWGIDDQMQEKNLKITYSHLDITNRYLEGNKFANLLEGRPKEEKTKAEQG